MHVNSLLKNFVHCAKGCIVSQKCLQKSGILYCNFSHSGCCNKIYKITNEIEFMDKVMHSDVPVVVNFHAEWCDPCKILSPKLQELVEPLTDVDLAVVDVETNAELVHTFEVKAVPAVLAIRNGIVIDKFIGLVDGDMIENLVNKLQGKNSSKS